MANLAPVKIVLPNFYPAHNRVDLNFFRWGTYSPNTTYIHIKTNIVRYSSVMYMIEAIGYNYNLSQSIQCAHVGYTYSLAPNTIYNAGQFQAYNGLTAHGQYLSSDDFVVLRFFAADCTYAAFSLNCYQTNPVAATVSPQVTAIVLNNTSGVHY